jgi:hypothetical protein
MKFLIRLITYVPKKANKI